MALKHSSLLSLIAIILLTACLQCPHRVWGDTLHLYNGQVVEGKLLDLTGDLIRFRTANGSNTSVKRLEVASHRDRVDLRGKHKSFSGEIIYVDPFKLELQTDAGRMHFWRLLVKDVSIGE